MKLRKSNNPRGRPGIPGGVADQRRAAQEWVLRLPLAREVGWIRIRKPWNVRSYAIDGGGDERYELLGLARIGAQPQDGEVLARVAYTSALGHCYYRGARLRRIRFPIPLFRRA